MGAPVPLEDLPESIRRSILPGTASFKAYAALMEAQRKLEPGTLTNAEFKVGPDSDPTAILRAAAEDAQRNPTPSDPSEGDGTLQFGPWDTGIAIPQGVNRALAGVGKSLSDTGLGVRQALGLASQEDVDAAHQRDLPLMNTGAGLAGNVAGYVAQAALPATGALKAAQALKVGTGARALLANPLTQGAAVGAAQGVTAPVTTGETRGYNTLAGGTLGAAGTGVTLGVAAAARPAKEYASKAVAKLADKANELGIPLRAAQVSASKLLDWASSGLDKLPFGSGKKLSEAQQVAFNRALARTVGEDTPDALSALREARRRNSDFYDDIKAKYDLQLEPWHVDHMKNVWDNYVKRDISADKAHSTALRKLARSIVEDTDPSGKMSGEAYKSIRSRLGVLAHSGEANADPAYRDVIKTYQYTLDSAFKSGLPADAQAALTTADRQWANMRTLEKISPKDASGDFDFRKLAPLLAQRNAANAANRAGYLYGQGNQELPDLARIGTQFLGRGPEEGPAWQQVARRIGQTAFPVAATGTALYALNHDNENPMMKAGLQAAGLLLASKGLGAANNSRWFERGVPWLRKTGEGLTMGGLGQAGASLHQGWKGGVELPEVEEGQTP